MLPLSKKRDYASHSPGVGNQRGDVGDLATRGVERANLQAVPKARGPEVARKLLKLNENVRNNFS